MSEYTQIFATLAGAAIGVVSGLLIQRQIFKRENARELRDRVYGPMFMETSKILGDVEFSNPYNSIANLEKLKDDYLFFTIGTDLTSGLIEVLDRFNKYLTVRHAAELALEEFVKQEIEKDFGISTSGSCGAEYIYLRLLTGKTMASALSLKSAIFLKLVPQEFIKKEKEKWGEDLQIEVNVCSVEKHLAEFEFLYVSMLTKMEKEPLYLEEGEQRMRLSKELKKLIEQVKPFVKSK